MGADENFSFLKTAILLILLLLFSLIIVTPTFLIAKANIIVSNINPNSRFIVWLGGSAAVNTYVSTGLTLLINVVLIPFLIDMMVLFEDF